MICPFPASTEVGLAGQGGMGLTYPGPMGIAVNYPKGGPHENCCPLPWAARLKADVLGDIEDLHTFGTKVSEGGQLLAATPHWCIFYQGTVNPSHRRAP